MIFKETTITGCFEITLNALTDFRGNFLKLFHFSEFKNHAKSFQIKESFSSTSKRGAIRGLHFESPPQNCDKIVICTSGSAFDTVLDIRKSSKTYGQILTFQLDAQHPLALLIPFNCAHGFQALEENTSLLYFTNVEYDAAHDLGIRWDSVGIDWPISDPILSPRDLLHPTWSDFRTPFL